MEIKSCAGGPAIKRQRMATDNEISPVLILDNLAANTSEAEIRDSLAIYGAIVDVVVLPTYASASVQFDCVKSSQRVIEIANSGTLRVAGSCVAARFSNQQQIVRRGHLESNLPSTVLVFNITELHYPIDVEVLKKVCEPHGQIHKIVIMPQKQGRVEGRQALIQMSSEEEACQVKLHLNGADIYPGSCRIKVSYCKQREITVSEQSDVQRDFLNPHAARSSSLLSPPEPLEKARLLSNYGTKTASLTEEAEWCTGFPAPNHVATNNPSFGIQRPFRHPYAAASTSIGLDFAEDSNWASADAGADAAVSLGWQCADSLNSSTFNQGYAVTSNDGLTCKVMLVHNVLTERMNCDKLFNLLCPYGNVARIKFLRNKINTAMVEMSDGDSAARVIQHLHEAPLFGRRLVIFSCQAGLVNSVVPNSDGDVLPDATSVFKDFSSSRENRFLNAKKASKNRIAFPNTTLHWWNMPPNCSEQTIVNMFVENGAEAPHKVNMFSRSDRTTFSTGLVMFKSLEAAVIALALVNHAKVPEHVENSKDHKGEQLLIKMNFSSAGPHAEFADQPRFQGFRMEDRSEQWQNHTTQFPAIRVVPPKPLPELHADSNGRAGRGSSASQAFFANRGARGGTFDGRGGRGRGGRGRGERGSF